jgi:formylglycine-generating enzyme required for sulfatase activity
MSHHSAMVFCHWLRLKTGKPYRLPTEAEWEYAARAGTTTATHVGDFDGKNLVSYPKLEPYAVFAPTSIVTYEGGSSCNPAVKALADKTCGPARVGSRKPNPWGFFDMLGNVFEMVNDYALNNSPYLRRNDRGPETNPTGPAQTGWGHVVRGGTWLYSAKEARAASRHRLKDDRRGVMVGFRVARTIR